VKLSDLNTEYKYLDISNKHIATVDGDIYSVHNDILRKLTYLKHHKDDVLIVSIYTGNYKAINYRVKLIIAKLFLENPNNYRLVRHLDNDYKNVKVSNLEYYYEYEEYLLHGNNKKCRKCKNLLNKKQYVKNKYFKDNLSPICKKCKLDIRRTVVSLITDIYSKQKLHSKTRGHPPPKYTFKEFKKWILSIKNFKVLYKNWVKSGYEKNFRPSVDRLDSTKGYSFDNIRLVTWKENNNANHINNVKPIIVEDKLVDTKTVYSSSKEFATKMNFNTDTVYSAARRGTFLANQYIVRFF